MRYSWDEYCLDREGTLLTRSGRQVDASRKVLDCITLLLDQRHRVVGHEELFRKLWGHNRVTNHQLIQIVVAARRAIGDDGQSQRRIRTISGIGYRWVGEGLTVSAETAGPDLPTSAAGAVVADASATPAQPITSSPAAEDARQPAVTAAAQPEAAENGDEAAPLRAASAPPTPPAPAPSRHPAGLFSRLRAARTVPRAAAAFAAIGCLSLLVWALGDRRAERPLPSRAVVHQAEPEAAPSDALALIEDRLWSGDIEAARAGLARLPPELARSPDVGLLEIRTDLESGRGQDAVRKLSRQRELHASTTDPVLRIRLLTLQSVVASRSGASGEEVLDPARQAVALVEANPETVPKSVAGEAYLARGVGALFMGRFDSAVRDLVRARDILQQARDKRRVIAARHMLAHTWLREGRLDDAADEFGRAATLSREVRHVFGEVQARNSLTRILIEQLRWEDALANSRQSLDAAAGVGDGEHRAYTMRLHAHVLTQVGRLGEAEALLRSAEAQTSHKSVSGIVHGLASGRPEGAAADSLALFSLFSADSNANLILSSQEGMLLLWTMAAQQMAAQGRPPQPSPGQLAVLQQPQSIPGRIARGRWLLMQGAFADAEAVLGAAFEDAVDADRPFYMTLAAEPLIDLLLRRRALAEAEDVLATLRGNDPDKMDRDFRVAVIGLRVAHARGEIPGIENAYVRAVSVAGERTLPLGLRALTRTDTESRQHLAKR